MLIHDAPLFRIYFGNAKDNIYPDKYIDNPPERVLAIEPFSKLKKYMGIEHLLFLHQVHGADGLVIGDEQFKAFRSFEKEGDYLLTNIKQLGLGVLTADCLPIVLYDNVNHAVGMVHAGWRGSVKNIARNVVEQMEEAYKTQVENIKIFFGPSAKVCCFQVSDDFVQYVKGYPFADRVLQQRAGGLYFDLPGFNRLLLRTVGVKEGAINMDYNICTICDETFFSFRRQQEKAGRQMTVVNLK